MRPLVLLLIVAHALALQPNILLLMADQLRHDYVTPEFTPTLTSLASRGLRLSNAYSSTPTCTPARSALLTGLSPWYHGMLGYSNLPKQWPFELPRAMAALGYSTTSVGKNHFWNPDFMANASVLPPSHGWQQEFLYDGLGDGLGQQEFDLYDKWFAGVSGGQDPLKSGGLDWNSWRGAPQGYEYTEAWHPTAWTARTAVQVLANYSAAAAAAAGAGAAPAAPFFLKVSFHRPHSPYDPPARLLNATPPSQVPPMPTGAPWDAPFAGPSPWCGPADPDAWCGDMPPEAALLARRAYLASVKFVDESLGLVLQELQAQGLAGSTWVLFLSDHGDGQGEHHLWRKGYPYELSTHVPAIIAPPLQAAPVAAQLGTATPLLAEVRDIAATVLDIAGAGALGQGQLPGLNGSSWACLVARDPSGATCGAGAGPWRTALDLEHNELFNASVHWSALVADSGLKYIFHAHSGGEQLFNLSADPREMQDLAGLPQYAGELAGLRAAMGAQFLAEGRGGGWVSPQGLPVVRAPQAYSPHFPQEPAPPSPPPQPSCPPTPPIAATCGQPWVSTQGRGGYYRSCGGPAGNLKPFAGLSVQAAEAWCCGSVQCAGFDYDRASSSGYYKTNALGGWTNSSVYFGVYKAGQVPGH